MNYPYASASKRSVRSEIRELLKLTRRPEVISFAGGLPDPSLFPIQDIIDISREVLEKKGYLALQYGPTPGESELLEALIGHMDSFGEKAASDQVCVTSSSQQGIDLVSLLLVDDGAPVVLELPSYIGTLQAFQRAGADMRGVPLDAEGMSMPALQRELDRLEGEGKKPRFIYAIPDFQNPTGITMTLARREQLLAIARDRDIPIIEDSPYREITFTGKMLPSLWTLSKGTGVIMLKTISKSLFPGMRLGWMVAEREVIDKIVVLKQSVDLCTPSFNQFIFASYIRQGKMRRSIAGAIACYLPKRDRMLAMLEKCMPKGVSWSKPEGGMFLWVRLPEDVDAADVFLKAVEHDVAYVIGRPFHCDGSGKSTLRLNYSFPSLDQIDIGIERLANAIRTSLAKKAT